MGVGIAPLTAERRCVVVPKSFTSYISSTRGNSKKDQNVVCQAVLSSPLRSRKLLKSQSFDRPVSRGQVIKRSCTAILDESLDRHSREGSTSEHRFEMHQWSSVSSETRRPSSTYRTESHSKKPFVPSEFDFLEPMMIGIRPEPPEWPEREAVRQAIIEQKAKSCDLPVSLRMIKKKQQISGDLKSIGYSGCCSVKKAISSMVFILVELQSRALQMRGVLGDEDLEIIMGKVQGEMHSSFLWLFQQVFSVTPELMIHVMTLLADYSVHSVSAGILNHEPTKLGSCVESAGQLKTPNWSPGPTSIFLTENNPDIVKELSQSGDRELRNVGEISLWNSILVEAAKLQSSTRDMVLDHDTIMNFVSPINVEVEPDDSSKFHRTDLLYQLGLSQEPNNPLLLCNYAQFLHSVVRDYDRAEECYKRAIQVVPVDGECLCQYANFLWTIRKDFWCAEERYLEALATEPSNPFYASRYAHFLWNTGGEDTCYPLDSPSPENRSVNL